MVAAGRGFTILELLVTLALVGVLLVASVIGFNVSRTPRALESAAAQVVADLRAAQQRARLERAEYIVSFSPDSGSYRIARVGGEFEHRVQLPRGVVFAATTWRGHRVTFSSYGNPDQTGSVRLRNRAGERTLLVNELGTVTTAP